MIWNFPRQVGRNGDTNGKSGSMFYAISLSFVICKKFKCVVLKSIKLY